MINELSQLVLNEGYLWKVWEHTAEGYKCIAIVESNADGHAFRRAMPKRELYLTRGNVTELITKEAEHAQQN